MSYLPVWPRPWRATQGTDTVWLDPEKMDLCTFYTGGSSTIVPRELDLENIVLNFARETMYSGRLVPEKFHAPRADFEPHLADKNVTNTIHSLVIEFKLKWQPVDGVQEDAYSIHLVRQDPGYKLRVVIESIASAIYCFQTIRQLFYAHSKAEEPSRLRYTPYGPIEIQDRPAFAHRGLNLDIARNHITPEDVKATIRAMVTAKLNRLHLHATDSQSWSIEIPALPELAQKGAYDPSRVWTKAELEAVQSYGMVYCIEVFLEVGVPGHTASIHHAFPDLITGYDLRPWEEYAAEPPSGQLKLNSPKVHEFMKTLLDDLLPRTVKFSKYVHIGGDEFNANVYKLEKEIGTSDKSIIKPYLQSFIDCVLSRVKSHGFTPIIWEDLLLDWDLVLPDNAIIQIWRSHDSVAKVIAKGYRVIFGPCTHWYLDAGFGSWTDPTPGDEGTSVKPPFLDWNTPYKSWRQVCSYDPLRDVPKDKQHLLLGGEVHLWGELTDSASLHNTLWPRVAAAAGVLWHGPAAVDETMTRQLAEFRERLLADGVKAGMVQMEWVLRNPGGAQA